MSTAYRVLALDGGGMRGIFTAAYLAELEKAQGSRLIDLVDLVVGTSTGGIIALGLASGRPAQEMLDFYLDLGPEIFARPRRGLRRLFGPKYDRSRLDGALKRQFGADAMNQLIRPTCITAHELVEGTTRVLDDHSPGLREFGDLPVWKVAAATSAAPTYFAPVQLFGEDCHVDGGIWANNPALVGITEAVRYMGQQLSDIHMLSVGTTSRILRAETHRQAARRGWLGWAREAIDLLQGTTSMASARQAGLLLPDSQYVRIDDEVAKQVPLDDVVASRALEERGRQRARLTSGVVADLLAPGA